jgi:dihydrodipicolinate synthase/N-acetylneuraminate lyase
MNTIGAPKTALSMLGWEYGDPRRPTAPVSETSQEAIEVVLREAGLLPE